ncbi:hypothetical protein FZO89_13810 [Luteimonas viscosa]|uniref:Uncharacterized protein n=1 Tax=Luteimonas viscosa TaxID=1132694 RepID=A0A5D4XT45_9GAMM|nr:hypothetical protein [Luteimonas viscosa]TYT27244.1 hypothetical protein FZO89_13810 [Luteimonas viscosa]
MSLTIGLAGMDPATEAALKAAFLEANERLAGRWQLLPETQADHIVVDMDSMYGPMSWLRLHASGKRVVGLTSAMRTQTDFRLSRPFSVDTLTALLQEIAGEVASQPSVEPQAPSPTPAVPGTAAAPAVATAIEPDAGSDRQPDSAASPGPPAAASQPEPSATPEPEAEPEREPEPVVAATAGNLLGWLTSGELRGHLRYRRPSGPTLLIDADGRTYHGPSALKPLMQYFEGEVARQDLESVDDGAWEQETAGAGAAQPLLRLVWLGGLVSGQGRLLPGYDPGAKYQLNRWPQTEREFPRHFRIATAMMKGPAKLEDIAEASGIALGEIADFVNANLATGVAEPVAEQPAEPAAPPRSGGLLGRLRGR